MRFEESQNFRQPLIWLLLGLAALPMWFIFIWQIIFRHPIGNNPMPDPILIMLVVVVGIAVPLLFLLMRLDTRADESGITINMSPLTRQKFFHYSEIETAEARDYHPIIEYGGWGVRRSLKNGYAYNMTGTRGVQLVLKDGKRILIGSQRADELAMTINTYLKKL